MADPFQLRPPFTRATAVAKVRAAENAWNTRDPEKVSLAYSADSQWRNRNTFVQGREAIRSFLADKWERELEYRLAKQLWAFEGNRIAVRFQYEYRTVQDHWFRAYGNENWEFDEEGLMRRREASINDYEIEESQRKFHWPQGLRPMDAPGLGDAVR
ncbi:MAG: nuclear transport factor 2 family protein [Planctomycetota bacterium]